jgi:hypothetical protein
MTSPPDSGGVPPDSERRPRQPAQSGSPEEALRRLEQRLDEASKAAERLMTQAAAAAVVRAGEGVPGEGVPGEGVPGEGVPGEGVPCEGVPGEGVAGEGVAGEGAPGGRAGERDPAGEREPAEPPPAGWQAADDDARGSTSELDPLVALVQAMRDVIPPDLQRRLIAALREVLLALRALIDWYLERLDHRREQGAEVQDIPIL